MQFWQDTDRLRLWSRAYLFAIVLAFVVFVGLSSGSTGATGRLGGDYPAFYGAGRIVLHGDSAQLYDWDVQSEAQAGLHNGEEGKFLYFAYPPFVALGYAPLALLPFRLSYTVYVTSLAGLLVAGFFAVRPLLPRVGRHPEAALAVAFGFVPLLQGTGGAQNTAITLSLFLFVARLLADRRDVLAGLVGGLLIFKPHFAVVLAGLLFVNWRPKALLGVLATAVGLYVVGAAMMGPLWPQVWWVDGVGSFQDHDAAVNAANAVSFLGVAEALFGVGSPAARAIGLLGAAGIGLYVSWRWWRAGESDLFERIALAALGALLASPHGMFYDAGVAVPCFWVAADRRGWPIVPLVFALVASGVAHGIAPYIGVSPLIVTLLGALGLVIYSKTYSSPPTSNSSSSDSSGIPRARHLATPPSST